MMMNLKFLANSNIETVASAPKVRCVEVDC
jgi:hypothetical protein